MTTDLSQPETPESPQTPDATEPQPVSTAGRSRSRTTVLALALVLSAVAVGGGTGLLIRQDRKPARTAAASSPAPTVSASPSPSFGAHADGDHFGSLSDLLLPLPADYAAGPDDEGLGNDTVLTPAQYKATFDQDFKGLSSQDRQDLENSLDLAHITGYALRTYFADTTTSGTGTETVEIQLLQENQQHASAAAAWLKTFADKTGLYRAGPSISGFPKAHCYLEPVAPGDKLDHMNCAAAEGDLVVTMQVDGVAPLDTAAAAGLLQLQLTRLAIPAAQL